MFTAREFLTTDISARNPLCGSGVEGGNVRALVAKHFAATVARHLPGYLTGRTRTRMTEHWARMVARSWSCAGVTAGMRGRKLGRFRVDVRSTETSGKRSWFGVEREWKSNRHTCRWMVQWFAWPGIQYTTIRPVYPHHGTRTLSECL